MLGRHQKQEATQGYRPVPNSTQLAEVCYKQLLHTAKRTAAYNGAVATAANMAGKIFGVHNICALCPEMDHLLEAI